MKNPPSPVDPHPGDFPFPLSDGPHESRYLVWVRNHANYMAVRGLLDYVRAVAVLARGAVVNAIVGLPLLLVISVFVAVYYLGPEWPDFHVTPWVLGTAAVIVALGFPFLASLMKISGFRRSLGAGTDSSVKLRDRRERWFGALLILIVGVAAFEGLTVFLDTFHVLVHETKFTWPKLASAVGGLVAAYGVFNKLLSSLGGLAKKLALLAVGALGLLVPLTVILFVADYLVFSRPQGDDLEVALAATLWLTIAVLLVLVVGSVKRAFSWRDGLRVVALWLVSFAVFFGVLEVNDRYRQWTGTAEATFDEESRRLAESGNERYEKEIESLSRRAVERPGPALKDLEQAIDGVGLYLQWIEAQEDRPSTADAAGFAGLVATRELVLAVEQAQQGQTWPVPGRDARWAPTGRDPKAAAPAPITPEDADALTQEMTALRGVVDYTTTLLSLQSRADRVEFSLRARSPLMDLISLDEQGRPRQLKLLSMHFKPRFDAAVDELLYWDDLAFYARLETAGRASPKDFPELSPLMAAFRWQALWPKVVLVLVVAGLLWMFCWFTVDINLTSIHGLYRDRLASAFLIGTDRSGDVDIEEDLDLGDLARHEAGSVAPYHLVNVALNLQGSRDIGVRDRQSDFFIFSKHFIGGQRTGYCRSATMERAFPQMSLSTAMAISAAAASPNMGSATSPALVALMTLLNVRLGIWVPNPGRLQAELAPTTPARDTERFAVPAPAPGYTFDDVFREEMVEVQRRWSQLRGAGTDRALADDTRPTVANRLVGLGLSGGGIRSATVNLGIVQVLHQRGLFDHVDYLSTVSGGGYLGSSLSALMRQRTRTESPIDGTVSVRRDPEDDRVHLTITPPSETGWSLRGLLGRLKRVFRKPRREPPPGPSVHAFAGWARLDVADGDTVRAGQRLLKMGPVLGRGPGSFGEQFRWRVRPSALLREVLGRLDEKARWVNVSDGGHIENLAGVELLRRRCKYVVIGDGEADPAHHFGGLATLIRQARIDLGIRIDIDTEALRLDDARLCREHWTVGRIHYPGEADAGYLLYLKSSLTGDEDEVIREYRARSPAFPHESTADQMFNEGQFEAYRSLGQHIGEQVLRHLGPGSDFDDLERWFEALEQSVRARRQAASA